MVSEQSEGTATVWRVAPKLAGTEKQVLFRYFSWPLIMLTKGDTAAIAKEQGWERIMEMSWFCHRPTRGRKPCGVCNPCLSAIREGFGWRVPVSRRTVSFFFRHLVRPLRSPAKAISNR
jgi:hypothetical protein